MRHEVCVLAGFSTHTRTAETAALYPTASWTAENPRCTPEAALRGCPGWIGPQQSFWQTWVVEAAGLLAVSQPSAGRS